MLCIMDQPGLWGRGSWNGKVLLNVCQAFIAHLYERYPATNKYAHETKQKKSSLQKKRPIKRRAASSFGLAARLSLSKKSSWTFLTS